MSSLWPQAGHLTSRGLSYFVSNEVLDSNLQASHQLRGSTSSCLPSFTEQMPSSPAQDLKEGLDSLLTRISHFSPRWDTSPTGLT